MKKSEILASLAKLYDQREELDLLIASYEKLLTGQANYAPSNIPVSITHGERLLHMNGNSNVSGTNGNMQEITMPAPREELPVIAPEVRTEAVEALDAIKSMSTETSHSVVKHGKKTYDVTEEWIGPRPMVTDQYGNTQKLNIDNNVF